MDCLGLGLALRPSALHEDQRAHDEGVRARRILLKSICRYDRWNQLAPTLDEFTDNRIGQSQLRRNGN